MGRINKATKVNKDTEISYTNGQFWIERDGVFDIHFIDINHDEAVIIKQFIEEALTYQPNLPKSMIGGPREFIFGYYSIARREQHRLKANRERTQAELQAVKSYLLNGQQSA